MNEPSWTTIGKLPASNWADTGICQIPLLAPGFRVFGGPPTSVWASMFEPSGWRSDMLDERWALDTTEAKGISKTAVNDAIVWIGEGVDDSGSGPCVWPPSRITRVDVHPTKSLTRIWSLRDSWHSAIDLGEAASDSVHIPWETVENSARPIKIDREVLQWWTLDVWCPACGALGQSVSWGMIPPPEGPKSPLSETWEDSFTELGGCSIPSTPCAMNCSRCETAWGDSALASSWWPKNPQISYEPPIRTVPQLLEVLKCENPSDLKILMEDHLELDLIRCHLDDHGIDVEFRLEHFSLNFPFTESKFWQEFDDAEGRSHMRLACKFLEDEIMSVEGFNVCLYPGRYLDDKHWPLLGFPHLPDYPYRKAAPDSWTYEEWVRKRLNRILPAATAISFDIEPYCADLKDENDTLAQLRKTTTNQ